MALSGTIYGPWAEDSRGRDMRVYIKWSATQDIISNTSYIVAELWAEAHLIASKRSNNSMYVGDQKAVFQCSFDYNNGTNGKLYTMRGTYNHNPDGTLSLPTAGTWNVQSGVYSISVGGTIELDQIPRASSIASLNGSVIVNGTNAVELTMARVTDQFWHKATLSFKGRSVTSPAFEREWSYVVPTSWLASISGEISGNAALSVQTYSDQSCTTAVGDPVTSTVVLMVPDAEPICASGYVTVSTSNSGTPISGKTLVLQGTTAAVVTFDSSKITPRYGASIVSLTATMEGTTVTANSSGVARMGAFSGYGDVTITTTVTDSRGYKVTKNFVVSVTQYAAPTLSGASVYRCDQYGDPDDRMGRSIRFFARANWTPAAVAGTITIKYGSNTSTLTSGTPKIVGGQTLAINQSYRCTITATDILGNSAVFEAMVATAAAALNFKPGGHGGAFGEYAEVDNAFTTPWEIRSHDADGHKASLMPNGTLKLGNTVLTESQLQALLQLL